MNVLERQSETALRLPQETPTGRESEPRGQRRAAGGGFAWGQIVPALFALGLFAIIARPVLLAWMGEYAKAESYYADAPIIPPIIALMFWYRRDALRAVVKAPCFWAIAVLAPALFLYEFAQHNHAMALESLALLLIVWSGVWLAFGTRWWRTAAYPLLFIALMDPLPAPVLNDATVSIQHKSTVFANALLHLMGFGTTMTGNLITMDSFALSVDTPCSGLHTLMAMLTVGAALAYLMDGPPLRRVWLVLAALPLALAVNSVRIALIGVCGECISPQAAHVFHDWSGVLTDALGSALLLLIAKGLGCRKFAGLSIF